MSGPLIRAAGGVVWRPTADAATPGGIEIAVIHRPRYDDWSLPKGKLAPGEMEIEGAVREVLEETGYHVRVGRPLGETRYPKMVGGTERPKVVRWWSMQAEEGAFSPTREVDELRWLSLADAGAILTRAGDREILEAFARGPAPTRTVLLVRHALAGSRSAWTGDDRERGLDDCGIAQADELVRLLARFDVAVIASADVARCTMTVAPLAEALELEVQPEPLLSELGYPGREDEAAAMLRELAPPGRDAVACSQGDVIPDLVERLCARDHLGIPLPVRARKGSTWALGFDGAGRLVTADHVPAPQPEPCQPPNGG